MNNHSFRASITVLTVATIVGCGMMLFSGFSQFRLRAKTDDKTLVTSANQKLRNRFGEFYPVEQGRHETTANSSTSGSFRNVSQSQTFDEVVTTTSEYDHSEVITSWSPGTTSGVPQVSVPVTINVNNGELMAQLIETRESLAEVKAQQSAIRQDQRVFSYQVHNDKSIKPHGSSSDSANADPRPVTAEVSGSESSGQQTSKTSKLQGSSHYGERTAVGQQELSPGKTQQPWGVRSASREVVGHSSDRMRPISDGGSVNSATRNASPLRSSSTAMSAMETRGTSEIVAEKDSGKNAEEFPQSEFQAVSEQSPEAERPKVSIEEEISFEAAPRPYTPQENEDAATVPVIEPISYYVEEFVEDPSGVSFTEATVVEFDSLEESVMVEVPAALPQLSPEKPGTSHSDDRPVAIPDQKANDNKSIRSSTAASFDNPSEEPNLPAFFEAAEIAASTSATEVEDKSMVPARRRKPARTREELASAFAAVRGLPPENLFGEQSTPFVTPIAPAEPIHEKGLTGFAFADSEARSQSIENYSGTTPPTITFGSSAVNGPVIHSASAASPVEMEFGEPSMPGPALVHGGNVGVPDIPPMATAEEKPEPWHKYRSRLHLKQNSAPSTPVPPVPKLEGSLVSEAPKSDFLEPALVPPAVDASPEASLTDANTFDRDSDKTVSDSPLMIPDQDGRVDVAQNSDSDKLGSLELPPIPELTAVPELAPMPERQFPAHTTPTDNQIVYEPQPVMDRLNEVTAEMSGAPIVSAAPPMLTPRSMPQKSVNKVPFETTFRRINKRVTWMANSLSSPEKPTAQQKSMRPKSPAPGRPQANPEPPTHRQGAAVAKKNSTSTQMQLPKLNVPKFTVQNFAMPNVNFRAIPAPSFQMPTMDTPDWLACPPDVMAPVRNSTAVHRILSTMQFVGQPKVLH